MGCRVLPLLLIATTGLVTGSWASRSIKSGNSTLSCYQCVRQTNQECSKHELVPCSTQYDRCVTHIENNDRTGYVIKRECGLGPCAFEDHMANRGLGLDACDRSKSDYFCVSCCRTSGCNRSAAHRNVIVYSSAAYGLYVALLINLRYLN